MTSLNFNDPNVSNNKLQITPGPGEYVIKSSLNMTPSASIKSRKVYKVINDIPGPGAYSGIKDTSDTGYKSVNPNFTKGHRNQYAKNDCDSPGPGNYNVIVENMKGKGYSINKADDESKIKRSNR